MVVLMLVMRFPRVYWIVSFLIFAWCCIIMGLTDLNGSLLDRPNLFEGIRRVSTAENTVDLDKLDFWGLFGRILHRVIFQQIPNRSNAIENNSNDNASTRDPILMINPITMLFLSNFVISSLLLLYRTLTSYLFGGFRLSEDSTAFLISGISNYLRATLSLISFVWDPNAIDLCAWTLWYAYVSFIKSLLVHGNLRIESLHARNEPSETYQKPMSYLWISLFMILIPVQLLLYIQSQKSTFSWTFLLVIGQDIYSMTLDLIKAWYQSNLRHVQHLGTTIECVDLSESNSDKLWLLNFIIRNIWFGNISNKELNGLFSLLSSTIDDKVVLSTIAIDLLQEIGLMIHMIHLFFINGIALQMVSVLLGFNIRMSIVHLKAIMAELHRVVYFKVAIDVLFPDQKSRESTVNESHEPADEDNLGNDNNNADLDKHDSNSNSDSSSDSDSDSDSDSHDMDNSKRKQKSNKATANKKNSAKVTVESQSNVMDDSMHLDRLFHEIGDDSTDSLCSICLCELSYCKDISDKCSVNTSSISEDSKDSTIEASQSIRISLFDDECPKALPCNHRFHRKCLQQLVSRTMEDMVHSFTMQNQQRTRMNNSSRGVTGGLLSMFLEFLGRRPPVELFERQTRTSTTHRHNSTTSATSSEPTASNSQSTNLGIDTNSNASEATSSSNMVRTLLDKCSTMNDLFALNISDILDSPIFGNSLSLPGTMPSQDDSDTNSNQHENNESNNDTTQRDPFGRCREPNSTNTSSDMEALVQMLLLQVPIPEKTHFFRCPMCRVHIDLSTGQTMTQEDATATNNTNNSDHRQFHQGQFGPHLDPRLHGIQHIRNIPNAVQSMFRRVVNSIGSLFTSTSNDSGLGNSTGVHATDIDRFHGFQEMHNIGNINRRLREDPFVQVISRHHLPIENGATIRFQEFLEILRQAHHGDGDQPFDANIANHLDNSTSSEDGDDELLGNTDDDAEGTTNTTNQNRSANNSSNNSARRVVVLMSPTWRPGDNESAETLLQSLVVDMTTMRVMRAADATDVPTSNDGDNGFEVNVDDSDSGDSESVDSSRIQSTNFVDIRSDGSESDNDRSDGSIGVTNDVHVASDGSP